ncbi:MAG: hypothetical protein ABI830_01265 [Pseudolabrys sp.]
MTYTKVDIVNELAAIHGYRTYLEICTPSTGNMYSGIDRARYSICHRLMYRCPAEFDDGWPIDLRRSSLDIADCVAAVRAKGLKYDVILVDPFHEYETSARDLREAVDLLTADGTIIVHDCFPRDQAITSPHYIDGAWCGVTYKAYLDFVLASEELMFCTIDADYGCGVIRRAAPLRVSQCSARDDRGEVVSQWKRAGKDYDAAFTLLQTHAKPLLNLVTVAEFLNGERNDSPLLR